MSSAEMLRHNDVRLLGVMAGFTAAEWAAPSLCEDWSNHDVLAHLVIGYRAGIGLLPREMLHRRGSFDAANAAVARGTAASRAPAALLDEFERLIDRPRGLGRHFRGACCSVTTSPTNSTSSSRSAASPRSRPTRSSRC